MPKSINQSSDQGDNEYSEHAEHTFCTDPFCPCKESQQLIGELSEAIEDGFATVNEADRVYRGRNV